MYKEFIKKEYERLFKPKYQPKFKVGDKIKKKGRVIIITGFQNEMGEPCYQQTVKWKGRAVDSHYVTNCEYFDN